MAIAPAYAPASPRHILMVFDGLHLFVPQVDVISVEIISDILVTYTTIGAVGWFGQHGQGGDLPIFCLSADMTLLPEMPDSRQFFVLLKAPRLPLGIACDEVENVNFAKAELHPQHVPSAMRLPESPISHLLIYQERIACLCSGQQLIQYVLAQSERFVTSADSN